MTVTLSVELDTKQALAVLVEHVELNMSCKVTHVYIRVEHDDARKPNAIHYKFEYDPLYKEQEKPS